ncbi:hypothetical protein CBS101457_005054 [Exobasidium rhododendri]|nr:hypothetical protein CBS101457_005054 [Exobasidium rhododendri]
MSLAQAQLIVDEKSNEKAAFETVEEGVHHFHTPDAALNKPSLEDSLYYADLQYGKNETPVEDAGGAGLSPAASIAKSPLRFLWGPSSPEVLVKAGSHGEGSSDNSHSVVPQNEKGHLADRKALRKVTAFGAFYLITTDILGPFNTGYAISQVGFAPGAVLYVVMGVAAFYTGVLINNMYLRLDSDRSPIRNYGQLTFRLLGSYAKLIIDILMIVQLIVNCGTLLLSNAQSMAQIIDNSGNGSDHHLCFVVCIVIFLAINLLLSPLRTLKEVGWIANLAVWLNIVLIWCTVGFVYTSPPNYKAAFNSFGISAGPVVTSAIVSLPLPSKVNGIMNMVFAYGGAMIFVDFFAEMRRPWDFWKSMACAQALIMTLYLTFGLLVYARQGQFTQSLAYYGVSKYSYQTVGNVIAIITGTIAAVLYGNIAQKLVYYIVVEQWFKGPSLTTGRGFFYWMSVNVVFWVLAFIVGAAIPQVQTISGLIAALCILQFTYTFPFLLKVALDVQLDAMKGDGSYSPGSGSVGRVDKWTNLSRWRRGLFTGNVAGKMAHLLLGLASLSMACLGLYGSGTAIAETFQSATATSFGCKSPSS